MSVLGTVLLGIVLTCLLAGAGLLLRAERQWQRIQARELAENPPLVIRLHRPGGAR